MGRSRVGRGGRLLRAIAVALLILASCYFVAASGTANAASANPPLAVRGVLDLTEWDWQREPVALEGEWEFYWAEFIDPTYFLRAAPNETSGSPGDATVEVDSPETGHRQRPDPEQSGQQLPEHQPPVQEWPEQQWPEQQRPEQQRPEQQWPEQQRPEQQHLAQPLGSSPVLTAMYSNVPGTWKGGRVGDDVLSGDGFGTYRLRVLLPEGSGTLAIYVPFVRTAHKLWVNGQPITSQGTVGTSRGLSVPAAGAGIAAIGGSTSAPGSGTGIIGNGSELTANVLDIVMHVSNFSFRQGGFGRAPVIAEESRLFRDVQRSLTVEVFFIASLLIIGVYHVGIWAIRPRDRHMLYFGLFCLVVAPRTAVIDQAPLTFFFPGIPWEALIKIEYFGFSIGLPLFLLFLSTLYPREFRRTVVTAMVTVCGLFTLFVLVTPARIFSHALAYFQVFVGIVFVYMTYAMIMAVRRRREGAGPILGGTAFVFLIVIYDVFFFWGWLGKRPLAPMAILGMVIAHSLLLSKRFSDEFDEQRRLTLENEALVATVQRQLEQIKDSRRIMHEREERTRRHVAELLHGTMQSRLLAAQHAVRASLKRLNAGSEEMSTQESLEEARRLLRQASEQIELVNREDVRHASHLLHPMLLRVGLAPAISSLGERFGDNVAVCVHISDEFKAVDGHGPTGIDPAVRLGVYRIAEEAMTNAIKHGSAAAIDAHLHVLEEPSGSLLALTVRDDGKGMDVSSELTGFGFDMITARVEELDGSWHVDSAPGRGTTVSVTVPLGDTSRRQVEERAKRPSVGEIDAGIAQAGVASEHEPGEESGGLELDGVRFDGVDADGEGRGR